MNPGSFFDRNGSGPGISGADPGDPSLATFMLNNYDVLFAPRPLDPLQGTAFNMTTNFGRATYNVLLISTHKSFSQGLKLTANYTWSHALARVEENFIGQQYAFYSPPTRFDLNSGSVADSGDRRHVLKPLGIRLAI